MAYYGVDLDVRVKELNHQFQNQIRQKGGIGIRSLATIFRRMDVNGNKKLDIEEFEQALATFGLFPKKVDLQGLMSYYDVDKDGNVGYEEFLSGLREELTGRKREMVERAFSLMDKDGSGLITASDIAAIYDVSQHKGFKEGTHTANQVLAEFLDSFDSLRGNNDGKVSHDEWLQYYSDLAVSTPSDDYFVVMMEQAWGIGEDEQNSVFQDRVRHLVGLMRQRLISISNGSQEEYMLRKIFNNFDVNQNGIITLDELAALLAKLEISVERKYLNALMKYVDTNKSGAIEFDEFATFVIYDPYK